MAAELIRGDTWLRQWQVKDAQGVIIDLTGASARLYVRDAKLLKISEASTATGEIIIDGAAGLITLRIDAEVTRLYPIGKHKFDLEVTDSNSIVKTYETETLHVLADITYD